MLWHTEIERAAPSQVAPLLGLPAAGVTELAGRAADGLRQAYLQLQAADASREHAGLADIGAALRGTVAPVVLGDAAAAYLASAAGPATSPGSLAAGTAVALLPGKLRRSSRRQHALAAGALLTTFGVAAYVLTPAPAAVLVTADGQSAAASLRAVSGHRTAAIALGPLVLPASAQAPARRPVNPPVASHRASSVRRPSEAAVPAVAPAPGTPPARPPQPPHPATPPRQQPRAQPATAPPNPVLATSWHMPGADWASGFAAVGSRQAGLPGWRTAGWRETRQQATPQWPAWHARSWQPPAWQGAQRNMPSGHGPSWHMPAWPGQGTHWQGWPGNR